MSNLAGQAEQTCDIVSSPCDAIETLLRPREADLGGFRVRRSLPTARRKMVGPWIFFDHMGPAHFPAGKGVNVRPHPHIGLATVTYLFEGEMLHRDSLGNVQPILPGDINLMVAGRGIVHSERERPETSATAHTQHGLQLWLALPQDQEEVEPAFRHYPGAEIPTRTIDGVSVRVMMGTAYGVESPVRTFADTLYVEAQLPPAHRLTLPRAEQRAAYVAKGHLKAQGISIPEHSMAVLSTADDVVIEATEASTIAVIGGECFNKRHIDWNFVSSRPERIREAKQDWKEGRFETVPGDDQEYIPLPAGPE